MAQKKAHEVDGFLARPAQTGTVILLYGPDKGLVSERGAKLAKLTGLPLDDPFAVLRIEADEIDKDPARLIDEARTISMFGGNRLIWIKNASAQKNLAEAVKNLISEPPQDTYILIEAGDLKKGAALRTNVENGATAMALPCYSDDARGIDGLIDDVLLANNLQISGDARQFLRMSLGGDRLATRGELEKLCLYARGQQRIELEDVRESVGDVAALSQDEVIDAVLIGDLPKFNIAFDRVVNTGTHPFLLVNSAIRQFSQLQSLRYSMEAENKPAGLVVNSAKPPIFFARKKLVETALGLWSLASLIRVADRLQRTVLESRQNAALSTAIIRQAFIALTVEAIRNKQRR
ncbi:DNA polymerase III subunit delta [Pseudochrobactrum sp. sp1633]|uniref:DNA polymerase III subunit delta n=1 Tax=Pseudochrobactrum sp. sp1633 TaxID=3036706 RepID=UPI0025A4E1E9|nr:DNA polymerase III subunit delta [Pseudochrobactrum sp. sp1633]MDM8345003.1 DNA polymerase III subunit delta [Pseudochrobactrum sp. sp1633]HWD14835.1 DNA polymerase III subunit delta [Pseudochrobactrum sp.]